MHSKVISSDLFGKKYKNFGKWRFSRVENGKISKNYQGGTLVKTGILKIVKINPRGTPRAFLNETTSIACLNHVRITPICAFLRIFRISVIFLPFYGKNGLKNGHFWPFLAIFLKFGIFFDPILDSLSQNWPLTAT